MSRFSDSGNAPPVDTKPTRSTPILHWDAPLLCQDKACYLERPENEWFPRLMAPDMKEAKVMQHPGSQDLIVHRERVILRLASKICHLQIDV